MTTTPGLLTPGRDGVALDFQHIDSTGSRKRAKWSWPTCDLRSAARRCVGNLSTKTSRTRAWWRGGSSCLRPGL